MRRLLPALLAALLFAATASAQTETRYGNYHALVIGNNDYVHLPRLQTAVADAAAVAELLKSHYAFKQVTLLLNARRADILRAMNRLRAELGGDDNLLIYYAGHGHVDRAVDEGYWQPIDAEPEDDTYWIKNQRLTDYLKGMAAKHVMVVADSCYSGTLTRSSNSGPPAGGTREAWLSRMASRRARTALSSGGVEPVSDAGPGGHSVFADAFLAALRENRDVLDGQALFQRLKQRVVANAQQTPQYADVRDASHDGGDFLFVPRDVLAGAPDPVPPPPTASGSLAALDLALWQSVSDSTDPTMLRAYLARFPDGTFATVARLRIGELSVSRGKPASVPTVRKPAPKPKPAVTGRARYVVVSRAVLRAAPTDAGKRLATLAAGTEVQIAGRTVDGDWLVIAQPEGGKAYLYAPLLRFKGA
ncbi:MAG: caspase family protein [Alphaproteobacteria bacterium]